MRRHAPAVSILLASACGILGPDTTTSDFEVAPYKAGCTGVGPALCLQVREVGEDNFQNWFGTPIGFDYVWGFEYLISVDEEEVENPAADESSIRRRLNRVVSSRPVPLGSTFELLVAPEGLQPIGGSRYTLFHGPEEIACSLGSSCVELEALVTAGAPVLLILRFPAVSEDPFEVVEWMLCTHAVRPCSRPA